MEGKANAVVSLGPLDFAEDVSQFRIGTNVNLFDSNAPPQVMHPHLTVTKSPSAGARSTLAFSIDLPSLYVNLSKGAIDTLQYWVDDVSQLAERTAVKDTDSEPGDSGDTSLIGSRFFAKSLQSRSSSGSGSGLTAGRGADTDCEFLVKVLTSEGCTRTYKLVVAHH
jgi:autophagy-related protein 2